MLNGLISFEVGVQHYCLLMQTLQRAGGE